jgi:hypothetical protein
MMMTATSEKPDLTPPGLPSNDDRRADDAPGAAIRWQAAFYRSYLADALQRLATDPNPEVQRIGHEMHQCLNCPSTERCAHCPFNRDAMHAIRGLGNTAGR